MTSDVLSTAAEHLKTKGKKTAFLFSATAPCEDNRALALLAEKVGSDSLYLIGRDPNAWEGDDILRSNDPNPNTAGAKTAATKPLRTAKELADAVASGAVEFAIAVGSEIEIEGDDLAQLSDIALLCLAANEGRLSRASTMVIPTNHWSERSGSYINQNGVHQRFRSVVSPVFSTETAASMLKKLAEGANLGPLFETEKQLRDFFVVDSNANEPNQMESSAEGA